jgi:hypothetical protein
MPKKPRDPTPTTNQPEPPATVDSGRRGWTKDANGGTRELGPLMKLRVQQREDGGYVGWGNGYGGDSFSLVYPVETLEEAQLELETQWNATARQPVNDEDD